MKLGERPIEERAEVLRRCGLRVDGFDPERGTVDIRVPRHEGLPLAVDSAGNLADRTPWEANRGTEFGLARPRRAVRAVQELLADLFGREANRDLRYELVEQGWKPYTESGWNRWKPGCLFTLVEHPRPVAARVDGRSVTVEDALGDGQWVPCVDPARGGVEPLTDLTRAIVERRLGELRRAVAELNAGRERAVPRHVDDYLPPPVRRRPRPLGRSNQAPDGPPLRPWRDVFRPAASYFTGHRRFCLRRSYGDLLEMDGYSGGNDDLDRILDLCGEHSFPAEKWGSSSPVNATDHNLQVWFLDGGLRVLSGNYRGGDPPQGVYVVGTLALRWLLWQLGCTQPRLLPGEARRPTEAEIAALAAFPFLPEGSSDHEPWPCERTWRRWQR